MAFETLLFAREESFAVITLNRPPANAISVELVRDLNAALNSVEHDDAVRSVIITGAGDRIFCAGADLGSAFSGDDVDTFIRFGNSVMRKIERFPKPVIAAINGFALGGGCELALACHIRIASEKAQIGLPEVTLGIIPGYGGTQRMARLLGKGKALELICTGDRIGAAEAERIGLVNKVVPADQLMGAAEQMARTMMSRGPLAIRAAIEAVVRGGEMPFEEGQFLEATLFGLLCASEDTKEGMKAFLEKRPPQFKGR
jgi:enoyl-CoA hydratase